MHRHRPWFPVVSLLALSWLLSSASAHAATGSFAVSATNVTMPAKGLGMSSLSAASVNGFAGTLAVTCNQPNAPMGAKLPLCVHLPSPGVEIAAGKTTQTVLYLVPYGQAPPPGNAGRRTPGKRGTATTLALAGVMLLGFGFRRRARKIGWMVLAAALFAASAGITACGGGGTQGTFTYEVVAADNATGASTSATFTVTLP